jgi:hypothetical protein
VRRPLGSSSDSFDASVLLVETCKTFVLVPPSCVRSLCHPHVVGSGDLGATCCHCPRRASGCREPHGLLRPPRGSPTYRLSLGPDISLRAARRIRFSTLRLLDPLHPRLTRKPRLAVPTGSGRIGCRLFGPSPCPGNSVLTASPIPLDPQKASPPNLRLRIVLMFRSKIEGARSSLDRAREHPHEPPPGGSSRCSACKVRAEMSAGWRRTPCVDGCALSVFGPCRHAAASSPLDSSGGVRPFAKS